MNKMVRSALVALVCVFAVAGVVHTIADFNGYCYSPMSYWRSAKR